MTIEYRIVRTDERWRGPVPNLYEALGHLDAMRLLYPDRTFEIQQRVAPGEWGPVEGDGVSHERAGLPDGASPGAPEESAPGAPSEKQRVYQELERVQLKCARLRAEVKSLRRGRTTEENAALRLEAATYRKALSNILHRLDSTSDVPAIADSTLRSIVDKALALKGLKVRQRAQIEAAQRAPRPAADGSTDAGANAKASTS